MKIEKIQPCPTLSRAVENEIQASALAAVAEATVARTSVRAVEAAGVGSGAVAQDIMPNAIEPLCSEVGGISSR